MLGQGMLAQTKLAQSSGDQKIFYPEWTIQCPSTTKWSYPRPRITDTKQCHRIVENNFEP